MRNDTVLLILFLSNRAKQADYDGAEMHSLNSALTKLASVAGWLFQAHSFLANVLCDTD